MLGKILERWLNRYYSKDVRFRSVMLIQGEQDDTLVKMYGTKKSLKLKLYTAMLHDEHIRDIVLEASELYREPGDDPMEFVKKLFELDREESDRNKRHVPKTAQSYPRHHRRVPDTANSYPHH